MIIKTKLDRIRSGKKPRVLDLFAGCGGLSLGFHAAGYRVVGALEMDPPAIKSHALNFHPNDLEIHSIPKDILATEPEDLVKDWSLKGSVDDQIDVIVGGPPCQAFARVGRAKLREVAEHPEAFLQDSRSNLYLRYLDYVKKFKPVALLMENVPDILNYGGHNIAEEVSEVLTEMGYSTRYTMLNAAHYGVPEMRERMFLLAYREGVEISQWFPCPTHRVKLPRGYHSSRQVALKTIRRGDLFDEDSYFVDSPQHESNLRKKGVTAKQALSDLPTIDESSDQKQRKSPRRFDVGVPYHRGRLNEYQRLMRDWKHFEGPDKIYDHVIRYLPRDYKIFARMEPGDQYPEAHSLAVRMFEEQLDAIEALEGRRPGVGTRRYKDLQVEYIPPYDPGKFPNKWRKMEPDKPARTLMAHLGKDSYSHIHYDDSQARTISVREAARLQSFPDGFVFQGPMNPAFRQIGNAVPPLLSKAIGCHMLEQLRTTIQSKSENEKARIEEAVCV